MGSTLRAFISLIAVLLLIQINYTASAQPLTVTCGQVIQGEFTENSQILEYAINLSPGDQITIAGGRIGDYLKYVISIVAPSRITVAGVDKSILSNITSISRYDSGEPLAESGVLGERGDYSIFLANGSRGGQGIFILSISCVKDGVTVNAGEASPPPLPTSASTTFTSNGFPGLAPVDFANIARIPLIANTPMTGAITPSGGEILGYTLDANAGDKLDLAFTRLSGNLNLGLVVLSAENQVVFQASLVTSETMSTRLTLPTAGQYTIGVFRIDLLPPAAPEATAFQVQGTLNP